MLADQDGESSFAEGLITTTSAKATEAILPLLQRELDRALPEARIIVRGLVQGPPVTAPVELRIIGQNLEILKSLGEKVRAIMAQLPEVVQAKTQLIGGAPKLLLDIDEKKSRLAGLQLGSIARQLETNLEGTVGGSLIEASEELPVRLRVGGQSRGSVSALRGTDVLGSGGVRRAANGTYPGVPLTALGTIRLKPAESPIFRIEGQRVNTVQAYVRPDVLPEEVLKKILGKIAKSSLMLPSGYRLEIGGDADARNEVLTNLLSVAGLIGALMLAAIVLTFNSYRFALVGGGVIILSVGLSALALAVFSYPFGIMAVIGLIGSIGVSINAAIIIITALQADAGAMAGNRTAIRDVVMGQSRHIVSTTVTTCGGFLPLILAGGGFWPPFAMAIAGGVLLSTVVSFYFVPPAVALLVGGRYAEEDLAVESEDKYPAAATIIAASTA